MRRGRGISSARMVAVNDIVLLRHSITDLMPYQNEHKPSAAPFFEPHLGDPRGSRHAVPHSQRMTEFDAPSGPHAPRQLHRRQKVAPLRMTVRAKFRLAGKGQEIEPMPKRRQSIAGLRIRSFDIKRSRQCGNRRGGNQVRSGFGLTHPLL